MSVTGMLEGTGLGQELHDEPICQALPISPSAYRERVAQRYDPTPLSAIGAASISPARPQRFSLATAPSAAGTATGPIRVQLPVRLSSQCSTDQHRRRVCSEGHSASAHSLACLEIVMHYHSMPPIAGAGDRDRLDRNCRW